MKVLLAVMAGGALLLTGLMNSVFGHHPYTVTAYFVSAEGLTQENDVVISGARVGRVQSVGLAPDGPSGPGGAQIVLQLDQSAPLHRGTRATIRPKGLLGNMFIELTPGPAGNAAIPAGGSLPVQDTASPVDLDQVLDLFDPQTRVRIQTLTRQGGAALNGRGSDLNLFLAALPGIMQDTSVVTGKISQQDQQLDALNVEFDRIAQMIASEDQAFRRDIANGSSLLQVTAAHEAQLQAELVYADRALGELAKGLKGHERDLNQILRAMPALLDELQALSVHSATSLAIINPCMSDIVTTIGYMASADAYKDANGNMLRVHPYVGAPTPSDQRHIACTGGH